MKKTKVVIGPLLLAVALPLLAACTVGAAPAPTPTATPKPPASFPTPLPTATPSAEPTATPAAATEGGVLATLAGVHTVGALELHDLAESLEAMTDASELGPGAAVAIKNAVAAVGALAWPGDLTAEVTAMREVLGELQGALVSADLEGSRVAADEAHEAWEDLSAAAYEWLGEQAG